MTPALKRECDECQGTQRHTDSCSLRRRVWVERQRGSEAQSESTFQCMLCASLGRTVVMHSASGLYAHLLEIGLHDAGDVDELAVEALRDRIMQGHRFDIECSHLATQFLSDHVNATDFDRSCLAQHIQEQIEVWLSEEGFES